ncbi:hypothetical protein K2Z83_08045 [Oscillochloris sp. ZM17-4]|uniref:hypothetical protein n=1 Tax=Oscillochloris sp. ZM17-4 TaxID=2866714 RepID=UPI001C72A11E|nr:hypothetical protein [Oscillochloris sp. ZM17-4]MBX0327627.1 hypothetical protein [Oscillochloris sp. ZM17-4]
MAVNTQRISTISEARKRRITLPQYMRLDGSRYLLGLVFILAIMSLIVLVQTGAVATRGYAISRLEVEKTSLMRERGQLQVREAHAQSLELIRRRAEQIGLRPISPDQVRYLDVPSEGTGDSGQGIGSASITP